ATFKMVVLTEAVNFPFFQQNINDRNEFVAGDVSVKAADIMLKQLVRWTKGIKTIRDDNQ
nr:NADPH-dependent FMN reductase [Chitinophagaceae bacterium]